MNVEADSLNAAVLGPDVARSSDTFNLFVTDVVRDMTQKTGQKCTAIRRVYAPTRSKLADVVAALEDRLAQIKVGDPSNDDVTDGPVATAQQLRDVRAGIDKLAKIAKVARGGSQARSTESALRRQRLFRRADALRCAIAERGRRRSTSTKSSDRARR